MIDRALADLASGASRTGVVDVAPALDTLPETGAKMEYVIGYLIAATLMLVVLYWVIRSAVRDALIDHYKVVHRFEAFGEWVPNSTTWKQAPHLPTANAEA
jgi:hypothetical protein